METYLSLIHIFNPVGPNRSKLVNSIEAVLDKVNLKDGMCISFHHHLRNGDNVLNMVMEAVAKRGIKDITIAASSIFPIHRPLVGYMEDGTVTRIYANYISGPVAEAISEGKLKYPVIMHTHGGRSRAIESGDLHIDVAFLAAPSSDEYGNANGLYGKSACGDVYKRQLLQQYLKQQHHLVKAAMRKRE